WNAETGADFTTYQTVGTSEHLSELLALEVNRIAIGCNGLTPEIFAREREVVVNEMRTRQGATGASIQRVIAEAIFPAGHPYRRVDSADTVAKLELKDACDFIAANYQRGKAVVVVSGDVDEGRLQKAAASQFGRLKKRIPAIRGAVAAVTPTSGKVRLKADVDEPMLIATWPLPAMDTKDYRMVEMAAEWIDSELEQFAFIYEWGHSSFTTVLGGPRAPILAVGIELNSTGDADEAIDSVEKSVRFSLEMLGSEKESERWQSHWRGRAETLLATWESLSARNALFADILSYDHDDGYLIGRVAEVQKSSPGSVRSVAKPWLSTAKYLVIEPTGTVQSTSASTFAGGAEEIAVAVDGTLADNPLPKPPVRPLLSADRYTLDNGLEVILWPYGSTPLVRARLVVDSGSAHDPAGKEGIAELVGAGEVYPDSLVFSTRDLSIFVDDVVARTVAELRLPGYGLSDEAKKYIKARLSAPRAEERREYERKMLVEVYGDGHPYARSPMSPKSIDKLHHDLVNDWARSHLVPKNSTLIVAGQFDPELVKKHIAYDVGHVSGGKDSDDIFVAHTKSIAEGFVMGEATKPSPTVELDVMWQTVNGLDKDHAKRLVLEQLLDDELAVLRSKHAITYGFYASYEPRKAGGLWRVSGEADASRADAATKILLDVLDQMRSDPEAIRAAFVRAREKTLQALLATTADTAVVVNRLATIARFDKPDDFYHRLPEKVAELTLADFHHFLVSELPSDGQVFGAFGQGNAVARAVGTARQHTPK
ncbi:MAG TPA: insulinase family protein, partial [Kofleriaceae bacterium]|nr:insulinase family protein [Kofleriaceae bacterium]